MMAQLFWLREEQAEPFRPFFLKEQVVKRGWMPRRPIDPTKPSTTVAGAWSGKGVFDLIFSELSASGPTEPPDATRARGGDDCTTDLKADPTAFRLNRGRPPA